jgi:pyruvate-formate lyase-activating enzyme
MKTISPEVASFAPSPGFIALEPKTKTAGCAAGSSASMPQINALPDEDARNDGVLIVAVMLTRRCNMTCAHCSVESSPRVKGEPSEDELLQVVRDAAAAGASVVQLTGGEPMLREDVVMRLLAECRTLGMSTVVTTNAFWGKSPAKAAEKAKALCDAGVRRLTISYDRFHAEFQGPEPAVNIARAAEEMDLPMLISINFTRTADDDLVELVAPFEQFSKAQMRFYDVQPVGRARDFGKELREESSGFCTGCCVPTVTDDGRMTACNGPSYFSAPESPLVLGSLRDSSLADLVAQHRNDPILETIRTFGPSRLKSELQNTPGFENFEFHERYNGMCDLCLHLTSQPEAMTALRERLSQPRAAAERIAAQRVMQTTRSGEGEFTRDFVNSIGACRVFLRAMREPASAWADDAERVLGRPDFDWNHHALHLIRCGLALPLQHALGEPALARWAPPFFAERLRRQALTDSLRMLLQREAMRHIAQTLREVSARGVLLKGTAMIALDDERQVTGAEYSSRVAGRSCCDVDVYISPSHAPLVRDKLMQLGFDGKPQGGKLAHLHQLEGLSFKGVSIEIHQTLQPDFCGLPEREMLARAKPLLNAEMQGLDTLDAEGMLLHSAVHLSKHLFAHGLKTAWDFVWLMDRFPDLDWNRLQGWVSQCKMQRGFWAPVQVLCRELAITFPPEFLQKAPRDKRQYKLEKIARRHLFGTTKFTMEDNPWVCHALYGAMSDSWTHRARCMVLLLVDKHAVALRRERIRQDPQHRVGRLRKLRVALAKWQQLG